METINAVENRADWSLTVIPYTLYSYLSRKGIGAGYLLSDIVLNEKLSQEDLAQLFYLNGPVFNEEVDGVVGYGCNTGIREIAEFKLPDRQELTTKIQHALSWSFSKTVRDATTAYLMGPSLGTCAPLPAAASQENPVYGEASPPYEFFVTGPKIWLTVKSGFLAMLKNPVSRLQFYREYLTTVGKIAPQSAVVSTDLFARYVEAVVG